MQTQLQLVLSPGEAANEQAIRRICARQSGIGTDDITGIRILKKSVDARKKDIKINLSVIFFYGETYTDPVVSPFNPSNVSSARDVLVIGAGPAGLFAALRLAELGLRPVVLERGKDVSERKRDIARISRDQVINPESNYCFGEGGAGTYSDGKLYTRSKKRGDNERVLELFCYYGADKRILYEAHPHIGTDKLPRIISAIRRSIYDAGGAVLLGKKVTDFIIEGGRIRGVIVNSNEKYLAKEVILACGHSARDIYDLCRMRNILLEAKSFAMGVRVEHPQELIDRIQYHGQPRGDYLPSAEYNLVKQVNGRGVYSFCMCPGGFIVPSATEQEEVVVNGMSPSQRNSPFANSGIVVEIRPEDTNEYSKEGVFAGLDFQRALEQMAWKEGGSTQHAPAQRLSDFVAGKTSSSLPKVSYFPGVTISELHRWMPGSIGDRLRQGFTLFGQMMKGYVTSEAVILGVESRTSSPLRIPRNPVTLEHISVKGLYPCGEGSGYAGGIVSSAVDGMKAAEAIALKTR